MASLFNLRGSGGKRDSVLPNLFDRVMSVAAIILFAALLAALFKGRAELAELPWPLWVHIGTIALALALTPVMLNRKRGDALHRQLGWLWPHRCS
jgi:ABC-type dipeptide/oligopeptide/nickel transport system permease subunit